MMPKDNMSSTFSEATSQAHTELHCFLLLKERSVTVACSFKKARLLLA